METPLLTTEEAARALNVHKVTVRNLVNSGRLKAAKVGRGWRFRQEDIDKLFDDAPVQAGKESSAATG